MSSSYLDPAQAVSPPGSGGTISFTTASSTAGSGNLTAYAGRWLVFKADTDVHVRFGASSVGAATAGDYYLSADLPEQYRIPKDGTLSYVRAKGTAAGKLYFRVTSGPV
jgi:hypothetical protein